MKKIGFLFAALIAITWLCGCATVSNVSEGLGKGVAQDLKNTVNHIKRFDAWIRKEAW
jgi:hypothetical protein